MTPKLNLKKTLATDYADDWLNNTNDNLDILDNLVPGTRKVNDKPLSADITLTGADIALTGYAKPSASSDIAETDTTNQAIGKIETKTDEIYADLVSQDILALANPEPPSSPKHIKTVTGSGTATIPNNAKGNVDTTIKGVTTDELSTYASQRLSSYDSNSILMCTQCTKALESGEVAELRSLPNGVTDDMDWRRVQKYTLTAGDITVIADFTNTARAYTKAFADMVLPNNPASTLITGVGLAVGKSEVAPASFDLVDSVGKVTFLHQQNRFYFMLDKGTTLATAQAALAGTVIYYQLATPVAFDKQTIGGIKAYANGSITSEPCVWGYTRTAETTVTTAGYPISAIKKVTKYDISELGQLTETDVTANCTFTDTTLTIGSFVDGTYFYDCSISTALTTVASLSADVEVDHGYITHNFGATSTPWTLTANEAKAEYLICTNAGGAAQIVAPALDGKEYIIENNSGRTLTIKTTSTTGVTIATGKIATIRYNGTVFKKIAEV